MRFPEVEPRSPEPGARKVWRGEALARPEPGVPGLWPALAVLRPSISRRNRRSARNNGRSIAAAGLNWRQVSVLSPEGSVVSKSVTFSGEDLELVADAVAELLADSHKPYAPWNVDTINRLLRILSSIDGQFRPLVLNRRCDCGRSDCAACADAAALADASALESVRRWRLRRGAAAAPG